MQVLQSCCQLHTPAQQETVHPPKTAILCSLSSNTLQCGNKCNQTADNVQLPCLLGEVTSQYKDN